MAMYTTGSTLGVSRIEMMVAELVADGKDVDYIARMCFDCLSEDGRTLDENKVKKNRAKVRKIMRDPKVINAHRQLLREFMAPLIGDAVKRIGAQINDKQGWLANKAANDVLSQFKGEVFGEEDKRVVIQIEGAPDIGTPDDA